MYDPKCYANNATAFPGVTWRELKDNWGVWWEYPCIYYTEEAFLAATDPHFRYARVPCDDKTYYWYDRQWLMKIDKNSKYGKLPLIIGKKSLAHRLETFFENEHQPGKQRSPSLRFLRSFHPLSVRSSFPSFPVFF